MPDPLDEYPIHQVPLSMAEMASSDRNAYDRWYFNAHGRAGDPFMVMGMGLYPNLGVIDAYASVRVGDRQLSVRASDALAGHDRLKPEVGPFRIEVLDPLQSVRFVCDGDDHGVGFDLTWQALFPAVDEESHRWRPASKIVLDAQRFAQLGSWSGELRVDGTTHEVSPDRWMGSRDRSWGIRPSGEAEPAGRDAEDPREGFWWLYLPLAFDDFALVVMVQEDPDGYRVLNDAVRIWPESSGRRPEQLGWPRVQIHYRSGTREPTGATVHLTEADGTPLVLEVTSHGFVALNAGTGYGGDPTWTHGCWRGENWVEAVDLDLTSPEVAGMIPFGLLDHVGEARLGDAVGWGLFEHATMGRHDPSGFVDWGSVAD